VREREEERRQGAPRRGGCCVIGLLPPGKGAFAGLLGRAHEQRPGTADRGGGARNQSGTPHLLCAHYRKRGLDSQIRKNSVAYQGAVAAGRAAVS
jgi:hypothetical protein